MNSVKPNRRLQIGGRARLFVESERAAVNLSFGGVAGAESGAGVAIVGSNALEYRVPAGRTRGNKP